jgi:hypothetical protein
MSSAAKEILIKSVAQALPTYIMSVFKLYLGMCLPRKYYQRLLVGSGELQAKGSSVAWKTDLEKVLLWVRIQRQGYSIMHCWQDRFGG